MSLRHTIKTLLSGPQTQEAPLAGRYGYGQEPGQQPQPQSQPQPQQYGAPASYAGYHQSASIAHGGPTMSYAPPQGQPMITPNAQLYGYAPPQPPQMFPPPQQQPHQYHYPQTHPSNNHTFPPPANINALSYAPPSVPPPTGNHDQFQSQQPFHQPSQAHSQAHSHYIAPAQYGAPPPVPLATHPIAYQQPTGNPVLQYAQASPNHQEHQQPPRTPLSPPPPYMQFEQPSLSQALSNPGLTYAPPPSTNPQTTSSAGNMQQQQQQQHQQGANSYIASMPQRKSSISRFKGDTRDIFGPQPAQLQPESFDVAPQQPTSTKPQLEQSTVSTVSGGIPPAPPTPHGIIHPSMLAQWSAATAIKSGPIPNLPSAQPQSPPKSTSPRPPSPTADTNAAPSQPTYPSGKGHKPTASVNRSFTFSKKNADGSPNWNGTLLTIDGMSSETFTRFVNGVYNFAGQDEDPLGLTPDQMRVLLERLDMPDERNYLKRYTAAAQKTNAADPVSFVNTSLIQYYSIFDITYITESNFMPIVTRDGFQHYMITEVLIDPSGFHGRFLRLLANFGYQIIDPFTKKPFGNVQFERGCLPPVPNDQYVARDRKQTEALQAREEANNSQEYYSAVLKNSGQPHSSSWGI